MALPIMAPKRPQLRKYQLEDVAALRAAFKQGNRRVLYQLSTGGGKSVVLSEVMDGAASRGRRVLALVHRDILVRQLLGHFANFGHAAHILAAGGKDDPMARVTVASVQTAAKRELSRYDLILVDEAHHACAGQWRAVIEGQPDARVLGVTATPARLDGSGLGDHFDFLHCGPHTKQLQQVGALARLVSHAAEVDVIKQLRLVNDNFAPAELDDILEEFTKVSLDSWEEIAGNRSRTINFCASIKHAEYYAEAARRRGVSCAVLHSKQPDKIIADTTKRYGDGSITMLIAVDLIDEGFDVPDTETVIANRPTQSLVKHFQQIGRCMRPPGPAIYIDMAGNIERIRKRWTVGLPTEVMEWTLAGAKPKKKEEKEDDREIMQSEEGLIDIDPQVKASRARLLQDAFALCHTVEEAMGIVKEPSDFLIMRKHIPSPKGKPYHLGAIITFCRRRFFAGLPEAEGLAKAAEALGYDRFYAAARKRGDRWAGGREAA